MKIRQLLAWVRSRKVRIVVDGKPYLDRYHLLGSPSSTGRKVVLHHFLSSDPGEDLHNHPWSGFSIILRGGYVEQSVRAKAIGNQAVFLNHTETKVFLPGDTNRLGKHDVHRVTLLDEERGCWTLFFIGKRQDEWGFFNQKTGAYTPWYEVKGAIP